ncbi:MAG TPA: hypothetical protein VM600_04090, partial [Actinomycetota bacterium]|nr:hypothetical protein [Actinomycetota bacterium]
MITSMIERARAGLRAAYRAIPRVMPGGEVLERDGLLIANCGSRVPTFNHAFVESSDHAADAASYFRARGLPFVIEAPDDVEIDVPGLRHAETPALMVIATRDLVAPPQESLRKIEAPDLDGWRQAMEIGFGAPLGSFDVIGPWLFEIDTVTMYGAFVDGRCAATSLVVRHEGT